MSIVHEEVATAALDPLEHVSELTGAKIRTFLFEVAEGVSNYRSLHSLTEQVEHQYHGRFLIELVQNAHDALPEALDAGRASRIAVVLDPTDSTHGSLLVANDGQPFTNSNFERLSQLGQSDKDPQKSIGNKGLGFRSVLEVSERPEVYSRATPGSEGFDGYCFAFDPEVVQSLVEPMEALAVGNGIPLSPVSGTPIVDWQEVLLRKYRDRVRQAGVGWLKAESKYLSPYLLPIPRREVNSREVRSLAAQGFATVVRLPLKSAAANKLVRQHMAKLSSSTLLFLDRVSALELRVVGQPGQVFARSVEHGDGPFGCRRIRIHDSARGAREYGAWTRELQVADAPPSFQAAVAALPGRWPEIQEVSVSIAVRLDDKPEAGVFSIYLPTELSTGSAVHVNAPFYGNMSRTAISFDDPYNQHLLQTAGELTGEVVRKQLAGKGPEEARAIVDMICPFGSDPHASDRWREILVDTVERAGGSIDEENLILAEAGWRPLNSTSLVPDTSRTTLLTEVKIRKHATFDIFHTSLSSRRAQLIALANARYSGVGAFPLVSDVAATVAAVAKELHTDGGDWNAFWRDVIVLLPNGQKELANHKVILGSDGQLHDAAGKGHVFFIPRQGTLDDSDSGGEGGASDVPLSLQSLIAFLNEAIVVYEPDRPNVQTAVRAYLFNGELVSQFRVETIFSDVLREAMPTLPVPLNGLDGDRCRDVLAWSLRLMSSVVARGRASDALLSLLRPTPVPCRGGWYAMSEASFGDGWPDSSGELLSRYLSLLRGTPGKEAADRVLLPPDHSDWSGVGHTARDLLAKGGVFDGLRLQEVRSKDWLSEFRASSSAVALPSDVPPGFNPDFWSEYSKVAEGQIKVVYTSLQPYVVGPVRMFPGMAQVDLTEEARLALCQLILRSSPNWPKGWEVQVFSKRAGYADNRSTLSALWYYLRTRPWLAIASSKGGTAWASPSERWHVPADVISRRATHFAHIRALPYELARQLDTQEALAAVLHGLGMPYLDLHSETERPQLLNELIAAIGSSDAPESNVLLGQIRDAWHRFRPGQNQAGLPQLPVRDQGRQLAVASPESSSRVYLPDLGTLASELEQFGLRVIAIYPEDARALREWFASAYGSAVMPTSQLKLVPRVGGEEWKCSAATAFSESDLAWLIVPMLALVAFHAQIRGVHSPAFQERLALLKEARIEWVPEAEVAVMSGDEEVIRTGVLAHWDASSKTLLVSEKCRHHPGELSVVLAQALERDDLELPLRIILGGVHAADDPPESLSAMLSTLRISDEQLKLVQEHLRGDVGHAARLIQVLCGVLAPGGEVTDVLAAESEEDLEAAITATGVPGDDVQRILRIAYESRDLYEFGSSVAHRLGKGLELPQWNQVLGHLGRPLLVNRDWLQQLQVNLEEARGLIKRVIAHLVRSDGSGGSFKAMWAEYELLPPEGTDLSGTCWAVDFLTSMEVVAGLLASWPSGDLIAHVIREASSAQDLRQRLITLGVDVEGDPDDSCRLNYQLVSKVVDALERMRQSLWIKTKGEGSFGELHSERENCASATKDAIGSKAFTTTLNETDVLSVIRELNLYAQPEEFRDALTMATDLASLQTLLQISDEDLAGIDDRLAAQRTEAQRRRHLISICGDEFDASEENRSELWQFLVDRIKFVDIAAAQPLDLSKVAGLLPIKASKDRDRSRAVGGGAAKRPPRQPKAVDELIGLSGEIFVFEMLKREYGAETVTASSWVSENSRYVFEDNEADDSMGCDFAFTVRGRTYRVEVKATAGDDESFTLGSSEIALAMKLASKKRSRRGRFILVHVKKALSRAPEAVVLPNPYDANSSDVFTIEEADARVRYKSKS